MRGLRVLTVSALIAGLSGPAPAADWREMHASQFPAKVQSITFGTSSIDAGGGVIWGKWTVLFDAQPPVARYKVDYDPGYAVHSITISPLKCRNEVEGAVGCYLMLLRWRGQEECRFVLPDGGFRARCPQDLRLD